MTNPDGEPVDDDSVAQNLRRQLLEETGSDNHEEGIVSLPAATYESLSRKVQIGADEVLAHGEALPLSARKRMLDGARRALEYRRQSTAGFQTLAARARTDRMIQAEAFAKQLGLGYKEFVQLERGETRLKEAGARIVVDWIKALGVQSEVAISCLERSLLPQKRAAAFAKSDARRVDQAKEDEELLEEIKRLLEMGNHS